MHTHEPYSDRYEIIVTKADIDKKLSLTSFKTQVGIGRPIVIRLSLVWGN